MCLKQRVLCAVLFLTVSLSASRASYAGFIDVDDDKDLIQTVSWPEPSTIMIFIPAAIEGSNRMNFEMGIQAMADVLPKITVQFKDGEHPAGATNFVQVIIDNMLGAPPYGSGGPTDIPVPFPMGQNHTQTTEGAINIHPEALGDPALLASLLKNLGAHEFGHVLGLDDDPRQGEMRVNVMDADFNLITDGIGDVTGADPFVGPSQRDLMMLSEHYFIPVPSAAGIGMIGLCAVGLLRRKR